MTDQLFGKQAALSALSGRYPGRTPYTIFTWGFEYIHKAVGEIPWKLAIGDSNTWHEAHLSFFKRHKPDMMFYSGSGNGEKEAALFNEDENFFFFEDRNNGNRYKLNKATFCFEQIREPAPGGTIRTKADVDRHFDPGTDSKVYYDGFIRLKKALGEDTLLLAAVITPYISACYLFGFEPAMEAMVSNEKVFLYACERFRERETKTMAELKTAGVEAVFVTESWGSCDIISPEMFLRFALPYQTWQVKKAQKAGMKAVLWSPGDLNKILKEEASTGCDAFGFEQPRKGFLVKLSDARAVFGKDRCLLGNIDSEILLPRNDREEIRKAVKAQLDGAGRNCPFILSQGSPLMSDTPPEAVDAMINSLRCIV